MKLLLSWVLQALALLSVAYWLTDIHVDNFWVALMVAMLIGLANIVVKPLLVLLTLPITMMTLGLFILVINGLLFWGVSHLIQGFTVATLEAGIMGALMYSLVSWLLAAIVIDKD